MFELTKANNFSEQELKDIFKNSFSIKEALIKMGYSVKVAESYTSKGRQLAEQLKVDISHFPSPRNTNFFEIGEKIEKLTIISGKIKKGRNFYYLCRCDCGNEKLIRVDHLKKRETISCGCIRKEKVRESLMKNLSGMRFGKLTALSLNEEKNLIGSRRGLYWDCLCDCGNKKTVISVDLLQGKVISCGCIISKGENKIEAVLNELNINFKKQYSFDSLKSEKGYLLKFDFAVFDKEKLVALIEYQGVQHYDKIDYFEKNDPFENRKKRDILKEKFAEENEILLITIPYWDYDSINKKYLEEKLCTVI